METAGNNIFTVFDELLQREDKEQLISQKACAVWMTGLSGSGKTTIAKGIEKTLHQRGYLVTVLDGDNVRAGINANLGFSESDRTENIRRIAEVTKLFVNTGIIVINCFVSPTNAIRQQAKKIIGEKDFIEIYINASLDICEDRDVKGLYKKARSGEIENFTGVNAPFEIPSSPDFVVDTGNETIEQSVNQLVTFLMPKITLEK